MEYPLHPEASSSRDDDTPEQSEKHDQGTGSAMVDDGALADCPFDTNMELVLLLDRLRVSRALQQDVLDFLFHPEYDKFDSVNAPIADVGDPRGSQDTVMTDAATESGAVITPEGARADREPLAPLPPQRTPIPPMQGEQLTSEQARQRSIQQAMAMQRAMAIEPIWRAAPGGAENMARRTAIVVGPAVGRYTTRVAADAAREANWRARGLAPLGITDEAAD